jgi:hypothetical protein
MPKNTFNYTTSDLRNPRGSNSLSSRAMFYQRSLYKEAIYPDNAPAPLDTWYRSSLYGKIDRIQNSITLKERRLKPLPDSSELAIDFVVDTFRDFKAHMQKAAITGKLNTTTDGHLRDIKVAHGWRSAHKIYSSYIDSLFGVFIGNYMTTRHNDVKDFPTFIPIMKEFLKTTAAKIPVTKTNYMLTPYVNQHVSGLMIDIGNLDAANDGQKYKKFISNPNFDTYRTCAKNFGFLVDKNMPWILTFDLFSKKAKELMTPLSPAPYLTTANFFTKYYTPVWLDDILKFKTIFRTFYNQYINLIPFYEEIIHPCIECPHKTEIIQHDRFFTTYEGVRDSISDLDWIKFYIEIREIEAHGTSLNKDLIMRRAKEIYNVVPNMRLSPLNNALSYVNDIYRNYIYQPTYATMLLRELST